MNRTLSRSARTRAAGVAVATVVAALSAFGSPAQAAAPTVDLKVQVGAVSFGAGSSVSIDKLTVTNAGTAKATKVTATIELIDGGATPPLTFTTQRAWRAPSACVLVGPAKVTCPLDDLDAAGSTSQGLNLPADERSHVPGGPNPVPMPVKAKVTVAAEQTDAAPTDNAATSGQVQRTVTASAVDWTARALPVHGKVGDVVNVPVSAFYPSPSGGGALGYPVAELIDRRVAPPGTEWAWALPAFCLDMKPGVERRCNSITEIPATAGEPDSFQLPLRIVSQEVGEGEFRVEGMGGDPNPANNCARIIVTVDGAPARTTPVTPACAQPAPKPSGSASPTATGALPVTGTNTTAFVAAGAALVLAGTAVLFALRRRRRAFTA
ncbi:hypothetical protein Lfu02_56150 [Longispora fulva]|uniref:LPXTG-motif cell wall-anchored protein n=1 Tax=Longispora fulva TaxID=619741 RepID=A0A8J7GBH6_9ACTN|nr:LPXTG cell wall anchor domain-containing protein [Longispora fulva]MBG6137403.1 LPXTG-motif cell wall-anchored protein [Longispora fulva]GIG61243.1 hypothetical protein Lfu02_56150 [Longispora fulva]